MNESSVRFFCPLCTGEFGATPAQLGTEVLCPHCNAALELPDDFPTNSGSKISGARVAQQYWCFISYRHADNKEQDRNWASWLHREIERYDIPAELVGTTNDRGDLIPEHIYPVFRDEESLPADADLGKSISNALNRSLFLVVICSPRAVESQYVSQEIEHFQKTGKGDRIIAAIIAGEPGDTKNECFPAPLREISSVDGKLSEPIAADFRLPDGSEGFTSSESYLLKLNTLPDLSRRLATDKAEAYNSHLQLMKLKVISGILGVPLELLRDRDKAYRMELARNRTRVLRRWLMVISTLFLLALASAWIAWDQRNHATNERVKAENFATTADKERARAEKEERSAIDERDQARHQAGLGWLMRSRLAREQKLDLEGAFFAGWALGFEGLGKSINEDSKFPHLLSLDRSPEKRAEAMHRVETSVARPFVWSSPFDDSAVGEKKPGSTTVKRGHRAAVSAVDWSPDGRFLASGSNDESVQIWDLSKGSISRTFTDLGYVKDLDWNADGSKLAVATIYSVTIFDANSGIVLWKNEYPADLISWSPDGTRLAIPRFDRKVEILDFESKQVPTSVILEKNEYVYSLVWSPDSSLIALSVSSGENDGYSIRIYNSKTSSSEKELSTKMHFPENGLFWSPDNTWIGAFNGEGQFSNWETESGNLSTLNLGFRVASLSVDPSGTFAAFGGSEEGVIQIWDLRKSEHVATFSGHLGTVNDITWSPDGSLFASGSDDRTIKIWSAPADENEKVIYPGEQLINSVAWSPDGSQIAGRSANGQILVFDGENGRLIHSIETEDAEGSSEVRWSPDGSEIASISRNTGVGIWDANSGNLRIKCSAPNIYRFSQIDWSRKSDLIVCQGDSYVDGKERIDPIYLFDSESGKIRIEIKSANPKSYLDYLSLNPDGSLLAVTYSSAHAVHIWDTATGTKVKSLVTLSSKPHRSAWSPDGKFIAIGGLDGAVQVRKAENLDVAAPLHGLTNSIVSLSWDSEGRSLAAGSDDGSIKIWDIETQAVTTTLTGHSKFSLGNVDWQPGHSRLASVGDSGAISIDNQWPGNIRIWDAVDTPLDLFFYVDPDKPWCRFDLDAERLEWTNRTEGMPFLDQNIPQYSWIGILRSTRLEPEKLYRLYQNCLCSQNWSSALLLHAKLSEDQQSRLDWAHDFAAGSLIRAVKKAKEASLNDLMNLRLQQGNQMLSKHPKWVESNLIELGPKNEKGKAVKIPRFKRSAFVGFISRLTPLARNRHCRGSRKSQHALVEVSFCDSGLILCISNPVSFPITSCSLGNPLIFFPNRKNSACPIGLTFGTLAPGPGIGRTAG